MGKSRPLWSAGRGRGPRTQPEDPVKNHFLSSGLCHWGSMVVWVLPALDRKTSQCSPRKLPGRAFISTCSTLKKEHLLCLNPHLAWSQRSPAAHVPSHPVLWLWTPGRQVTMPCSVTHLSGAQGLGSPPPPRQKIAWLSCWALSGATGLQSRMLLSWFVCYQHAILRYMQETNVCWKKKN